MNAEKGYLADAVREAVKDHSDMDDVFDEDEIKAYCKRAFEPQEIYDDDELFAAARDRGGPADVFAGDDGGLHDWAYDEGYRKPRDEG